MHVYCAWEHSSWYACIHVSLSLSLSLCVYIYIYKESVHGCIPLIEKPIYGVRRNVLTRAWRDWFRACIRAAADSEKQAFGTKVCICISFVSLCGCVCMSVCMLYTYILTCACEFYRKTVFGLLQAAKNTFSTRKYVKKMWMCMRASVRACVYLYACGYVSIC
jgi:hypothetical protein